MMRARVASVVLMAWAASIGACSPSAPVDQELQKEEAERQALIEAMEHHPALQNGTGDEATGKAINVPTTIRPKPKGNDGHQGHAPDPHSNHM